MGQSGGKGSLPGSDVEAFSQAGLFYAYSDACNNIFFEDPERATEFAVVAIELAKRINPKNQHLECRAIGLRSTAYRIEKMTKEAVRELGRGLEIADGCSCCRGSLLRRYGVLLQYSGEFSESLQRLDESVACFQEYNDLEAIGRVEVNRGVSLKYLNRDSEALESQRKGLALLSWNSPQIFHLAALTNISFILAESEDDALARFAKTHISEFRTQLRGVGGFTRVRVNVSWIDGLLHARLGERKAALQMLRKARLALIRQRRDQDALAITADIASLYCDTFRYHLIVQIIHDTLERFRDFHGSRDLLEKVFFSAKREAVETAGHLEAFRQSIDAQVPNFLKRTTEAVFAAP